ncbi:MAG: GNAT family N-acetyltransferase [Phototrophicaceae bacterium]
MSAQTDIIDFTIHMDVSIRQLEQSDLPKLEWYGQFQHYRRLFLRSYQGQLAGNRILLVADVNDFPVGRLFIQLDSARSRLSDGHTKAYLYSFHVMEMFRGQHIGTQLIVTAENILRSRHFEIATIAVAKDNTGGLRLYQRQAYVIYGEEAGNWQYTDHRGHVQFVHEPCWLLQKTL